MAGIQEVIRKSEQFVKRESRHKDMEIGIKFANILEKLAEDFSYKNINDEEIGVDDYLDDCVDFERVKTDRKCCVRIVEDVVHNNSERNEIELAVAMYANFFIKSGMAGRFQGEELEQTFDGLETVLTKTNNSEGLKILYLAIKNQEYDKFWDVLECNADSIVARIYLFVRYCNAYCKEASEHFEESLLDTYEEMWRLYETLPTNWKNYVLGSGECFLESENPVADSNLLPYMNMKSTKEYLVEYISSYYDNILKKLNIDADIDSGFVYSEILDKLGLIKVGDFLFKDTEWIEQTKNSENMIAVMCDRFEKLMQLIGECVKNFNKMNEDMDATFLAEKLHCLKYKELTQWIEGNDLNTPFVEMYPALRNLYLHIPVSVPFSVTLFLTQYDVLKKNRQIRKNAKKKSEMMDYYAHSWKHIAYPQIVKEIAEELSKTNISMANRLIKAYNSEKTLQRGIQLLQYTNSDDESAVSNAFKEGMAKTGSGNGNIVSLKEAILQSLDLVVFKILMVESDDSSRMKKCREKWAQCKSLENLKNDYIKDFLEVENSEIEIDQWVKSHLVCLNIKMDETWEKVRFKEDSFALNQFKEILVEIFTNFFVHGNVGLEVEFKSDEKIMIILTKNDCVKTESESGRGISTMTQVLDGINYGTGISSVSVDANENTYQMCIRINKAVLVRRGR